MDPGREVAVVGVIIGYARSNGVRSAAAGPALAPDRRRGYHPAMRVGIDYLPAVTHAPGRGRYARELVRALCLLELDDVDLRLFEIGRGPRRFSGAALGLDQARFRVKRRRSKLPRRVVEWVDRIVGLGADGWLGGCDVFHHTSPVLPPVGNALEILPIAELPPEGSPEESKLREGAQRMARVVVFSQHYASEVPRRLGVDPKVVRMTHVGCGHWRRSLETLPARDEKPYMLALGCPRDDRRPELLLAALEVLLRERPETRLVIAGSAGAQAERFERKLAFSVARNAVEWRRTPSEAELPAIVARASCVVHLAREEGTPVTGLEALSMGTPVVASRIPAFVEALQGDAAYVDLERVEERPALLAEAVLKAFAEADDATRVRRRIQRASAFTWLRTASETLDVWRDAVHDVPPED